MMKTESRREINRVRRLLPLIKSRFINPILLYSFMAYIGVSSVNSAAERTLNHLDQEDLVKLDCAANASSLVYHEEEGGNSFQNDQSTRLRTQGYEPLFRRETGSVVTTGWYNEQTHHLIVAHRGTIIHEIDNLFADLGIVEGAVREDVGTLTTTPPHREFTRVLTHVAQNHIARAC
jgi:hypothetical protein